VVRTLGPGDSFGEIALRMHVKRTGTIFTSKETHFMILNRENYNLILSNFNFVNIYIVTEKYDL